MFPIDSSHIQAAIELAKQLLSEAADLQTSAERRQQAELDRMIQNEADKATLVEMTDQAFRTHTAARVADQLTHLLDVQGIPRFFSPVEQAMLRGFQAFGEYLPGVAVPLVKEQMRRETANVILPAEKELLANHLSLRQQQGVSMNVNLLGEALLGESETHRRMATYFEWLRMPEVQCLSVKLTTLFSHVSALARRHTIAVVSDRLEQLYRVAGRQRGPQGEQGKFIYLDMEEFRDLHLTVHVLRETLDRPGLEQARAGIALQAYLPDSYLVLRELIDWSKSRVAQGGSPLTVRLVKGANMEMERVDASLMGHEPAPYSTKLETDANFKRMLRDLLDAASQGILRVGIASHNLFDVALAMLWTERAGCHSAVQFEMLEGMANHQRRAITKRDQPMLLYAPACKKSDFLHAIGYLIRRLDENTGRENFLRHSYRLKADSSTFQELAHGFEQSFQEMDSVSDRSRRRQDRRVSPTQPVLVEHWKQFVNEPDTDWSLPHQTRWVEGVLERWQSKVETDTPLIHPVLGAGGEDVRIDGPSLNDARDWRTSHDVSHPERVTCRFRLAGLDEVRDAAETAHRESDWTRRSTEQRHSVLRSVAQKLRERRGDFIGAMVSDGGKTVAQADPEISEAIDFCEFYPLTWRDWEAHTSKREATSVKVSARGVVAVITPWNFPLAIPCGGIVAALAVGNTVLLKPACETLLPAWLLCQAFWEAGVPKQALQFVPCEDAVAEAGLVKNEWISTVVLTGGTATAKRMLHVRPDLHLLAETGGKNATIVTAMADRDLAIKHVVDSAFGHSGQKCSATSLLLLEDEVFQDPQFRERLADAVHSLHVGSAWDLHTDVTPLVCPPGKDLIRGLKELEDEESWLVMPEHVEGHPTLYRPGVKWNVRPGSFSHRTELFGPVLSVMRFGRLEEAIGIVRSTGYGLTSGLESLDEREIELWKHSISAGNLYINRSTTGAIVLRQPFGGVGWSAYGPGVKAGGPHYVLAFAKIEPVQHKPEKTSRSTGTNPLTISHLIESLDHAPLCRFLDWLLRGQVPEDLSHDSRSRLLNAVQSQAQAVASEFAKTHDTFQLMGQDNLRLYQPVDAMTVRITKQDDPTDVLIVISACVAVGTQVTLSTDPEWDSVWMESLESMADWLPGILDPIVEKETQLMERIAGGTVSRLRTQGPLSEETRLACGETFVTIIQEPVVLDGRIECLRYLNEQSVSHDYHRYGNLGRRSHEFTTIDRSTAALK